MASPPAYDDDTVDIRLALAARLIKDARARGHHNEAERLRAWIDHCLDERLRRGGR